MSEQREDAPLCLVAPATVERIRAVLDRADYSELGMAKTLGVEGSPLLSIQPAHRPQLLRKAGSPEPLLVLIRLFMLGGTVGLGTLRGVLQPTTPEEWTELALLNLGPAGAAAARALLPFQEFLLAFDDPLVVGSSFKPICSGQFQEHRYPCSSRLPKIAPFESESPPALVISLNAPSGSASKRKKQRMSRSRKAQ